MTTNDAHVYNSPEGWVAEHTQRYVATDGQDGQEWHGAQTLLLTTKGRKSGKLRRTPLIYGKSGSSYVVVASAGGDEKHPAWYLNLAENPEVALQVGAEDLVAIARTADDAEKPELWQMMCQIWPAYEEYQAKTDRPLPVVVLDPV